MRDLFVTISAVLLISNAQGTSSPPLACAAVTASKSVAGSKVTYDYILSHQCKAKATQLWIGAVNTPDGKDYTWELVELPIGWSSEKGLPKQSAQTPKGWKVSVVTQEESEFHIIEWAIEKPEFSLPMAKNLTGMSVTLRKPDDRYLNGHWRIFFDDTSSRVGTLSHK